MIKKSHIVPVFLPLSGADALSGDGYFRRLSGASRTVCCSGLQWISQVSTYLYMNRTNNFTQTFAFHCQSAPAQCLPALTHWLPWPSRISSGRTLTWVRNSYPGCPKERVRRLKASVQSWIQSAVIFKQLSVLSSACLQRSYLGFCASSWLD